MDKELIKSLRGLFSVLLILVLGVLILMSGILMLQVRPDMFVFHEEEKTAAPAPLLAEDDIVKDGVHVATGLVAKDGYETVIANCTNCHAADLITQNRGTKERWTELIHWMQETQGLWDLGANEAIIVDYLSTYYAPEQHGRRANLTDIQWYELKE